MMDSQSSSSEFLRELSWDIQQVFPFYHLIYSEFKNSTHGQGTLNHILDGYEPFKGFIEKNRSGSLISTSRYVFENIRLSLVV
jgi:predicted membrane GTPase involved in stress response